MVSPTHSKRISIPGGSNRGGNIHVPCRGSHCLFSCRRPSFERTDWSAIYYLYNILYEQHHTPFIALNKAIAALYAKDATIALEELQAIKGLNNYYLYHTAIGEVCFAAGNKAEAQGHYQNALSLTHSSPEQQLLQMKIRSCEE